MSATPLRSSETSASRSTSPWAKASSTRNSWRASRASSRPDHAEVEQPDPAVGPEHVPGVGVGVEEALLEHLLVVGLHQLARRLDALGSLGRLEQRHAADDLVHHQQPARRELAVAARHGERGYPLDDLAHADDVARLLAEVELVAQGARQLLGRASAGR